MNYKEQLAARLHRDNGHHEPRIPSDAELASWGAPGQCDEPAPLYPREPGDEPDEPVLPKVFSLRELVRDYPSLRPAVVDGLLRQGEVANVVSKSKRGKSFTGYGLALSVVAGVPWLGRFNTTAGRVLLFDNELHSENLAYRIPAVADAMGLAPDDYLDRFHVLPVRGDADGAAALERHIDAVTPGTYSVVIIDALYRILPGDISENDNSAMTTVYNRVDRWAAKTGAAIVIVHHASKGLQGDKDTTDVGSGAGSQSRAVDTHLVLRPHEEEDCVVLDAAVRSWPPVEPLGLRWAFPVWVPDTSLDVDKLKGKLPRGEARAAERDSEAQNAILDACPTWRTRREIRRATGMGEDRVNRAVARLIAAKLLEGGREDRPRNPACEVFRKTIHAR